MSTESVAEYLNRTDVKRYQCHKVVDAGECSRGKYNELRGWDLPEDEDASDKGLIVVYSDGYVSWSPKAQFEDGYTEMSN